MHWQTKRRLSFAGSIGILAIPALGLGKAASRSDRPFRRAVKAGLIASSVGGLVGGSVGMLEKSRRLDFDQAEQTLVDGVIGAIAFGAAGIVRSLAKDARESI